MRIDVHVHSKFSKRPSQWVLQKIGCPESFTEPAMIYRMARKRGMSAFTITDHNDIRGALEVAHLPNTFVSEEITTYFPEDKCKAHVLALNITESQHTDIQRLRPNIFELTDYLVTENILHILAHPLYAVNDRLTPAHFEKFLLLFKNFELNGARNHHENICLREIVTSLTPEVMARLSEKHGIEAKMRDPWRKQLFGGSDDHSSLNVARTFSEVDDIGFLTAGHGSIDNFTVTPHVNPSTPLTMAHNLYGIAYQFYRRKFNLGRYASQDTLLRFLDLSLNSGAPEEDGAFRKLFHMRHFMRRKARLPQTDSLKEMLIREANKCLSAQRDIMENASRVSEIPDAQEENWFEFVNTCANQVMRHFAEHTVEHLSGVNVFNLFHTIGSAGGLYTLLAPYFVAFSLFSRDRDFSEGLMTRFAGDKQADADRPQRFRVAHFTDTFYEVNGVARTLRQNVRIARQNNKELTIITCDRRDPSPEKGVKQFRPVSVHELPEYPEQKLFCPPFLEILRYCYERQFSCIHSATPGPMGLAALAVSRILKIPISGTYHTAIPQYAKFLTGDDGIMEMAWKYIVWYYDQMDFIYAPSRSTRVELADKGIDPAKIKQYPRGIDIQRFGPSHRNGCLKRFGVREGVTFLYVGRVSREKNLHVLEAAFRKMCSTHSRISLVVVGDGPYLDQMKTSMKDLPVYFTGYLQGETLAGVYASSDIFTFPSATDTFGNVVLEAQASGIPVIVTDTGGPAENMLHGKTGLCVRAEDAGAFLDAMVRLTVNTRLRETMGRNARAYMESRSFDAAFIQMWEMYKTTLPVLNRQSA